MLHQLGKPACYFNILVIYSKRIAYYQQLFHKMNLIVVPILFCALLFHERNVIVVPIYLARYLYLIHILGVMKYSTIGTSSSLEIFSLLFLFFALKRIFSFFKFFLKFLTLLLLYLVMMIFFNTQALDIKRRDIFNFERSGIISEFQKYYPQDDFLR